MKVSSIGNYNNSINFGSALPSGELKPAYNAAQSAREAMGYQGGKGVLMLPSDKLPQGELDTGIKDKVKQFFAGVKNLLGINTVEVVGEGAANIDDILKEEGLAKIKKFEFDGKGKFEDVIKNIAREADGIRIVNAQNLSDEQLSLVEKIFKEIKGDAYDSKLLLHEVSDDNALFDWGNSAISQRFKGKTVVGSTNYLNNNGGNLWGSNSFFTDRMNTPQGDFIHGIRKLGEQTLSEQMYNPGQVNQSINLLENELKLQSEDILEPHRWIAAKRADVASAQSFYKHFDDLVPGSAANVLDFEQIYHSALQEGKGDNYFDSLAKVMKAKGLDETQGELYATICKYRNALYAKGPLNIEDAAKLTAEQLEATYKNVDNVVLQGFNVKQAALNAKKAAQEAMQKEAQLFEAHVVNIRPLDSFVDKAITFGRKNKTALMATGAVALLALVGGTMYSCGKETAAKQKAATPKPEPRLDKKA